MTYLNTSERIIALTEYLRDLQVRVEDSSTPEAVIRLSKVAIDQTIVEILQFEKELKLEKAAANKAARILTQLKGEKEKANLQVP